MRTTIKQIAKLANVSAGTVDRVVNNRGKVKEKTKEKIEKIIRELDYKPNLFARNLALDPSFNIAVIMPFPEQDGGYWHLPLNGIEKAFKNLQHFRLNIELSMYDKFSRKSFVTTTRKVLKSKFDGVLIAPIHMEETKAFLKKLPKKIPYVLIDTDIPGVNSLSSIHQNSFHGGVVAAQLMDMVVQTSASVAIVRFLPDTIHINKRMSGFNDYMTNRKDITLIDIDIEEHCPKQKVHKLFKKLYADNSDLRGIFVTGSHTYEVAQCIEKLKTDKKIYLIGFDLIPANIDYMKKSIIDFLISQNPEQQGYAGIYSLYRHLVVREKINQGITIPIEIITKENLSFHNSETLIREI